MQSVVLRHLICDAGVRTPLFHNASNRFLPSAIQQAKNQFPQQLSAATISGTLVFLVASTPAQLAYLAYKVPLPQHIHTIRINLPFKTHGPESMAMAAALRLLADHLRRDIHLQELTINVNTQEYVSALLQGGTGFKRIKELWGNILVALRAVFESNSSLRTFHIHSPPDILPADELASLQTAMAVLPNRLRMAVLMGQHQRLGSHSHISRLPVQLMEAVLELAVPKEPCRLQLSTATVELPDSSDESSDSDDSSSSGSDDSSNDSSDSDDSSQGSNGGGDGSSDGEA